MLDDLTVAGIIQLLNFDFYLLFPYQEIRMSKALITGITGQDGSYLAEFLLSKGYEVHGMIRKASTFNTERIDHIYQDPHDSNARLFLHYGDLSQSEMLIYLIYNVQPDEVYNLGAQSHVKVSFEMPEYTGSITGLGATRILEAIRSSRIKARFYQASSSEMFGSAPPPQKEDTPFEPRSPYAIAKTYAYWMTVNYREAYGLFAVNGILFNHESPRRGETFLTRKVTRAVARILSGMQDKVFLGNLDARRDYGYAPEYVEVIWRMLQQEDPDDYVVGTGVAPTIREFVQEAFDYAGLDWEQYVEIDSRYFRPTEVDYLQADSSKARKMLDWAPKITYKQLARIMVDADMEAINLTPIGEGLKIIEQSFDDWHRWETGVTAVLANADNGFE
jgi:GDPmannose 4,6-dehydratase